MAQKRITIWGDLHSVFGMTSRKLIIPLFWSPHHPSPNHPLKLSIWGLLSRESKDGTDEGLLRAPMERWSRVLPLHAQGSSPCVLTQADFCTIHVLPWTCSACLFMLAHRLPESATLSLSICVIVYSTSAWRGMEATMTCQGALIHFISGGSFWNCLLGSRQRRLELRSSITLAYIGGWVGRVGFMAPFVNGSH